MKDQKGFALIQVVIAASIFTVLSLAISNVIVEQRAATAYLEDQLERVELIRNFESILKDGTSCQRTLTGSLVDRSKSRVTNVTTLKDNSGNVIYRSNSNSGFLRIGQISFKNESVSSPSSSGFINIQMPVSRQRKGGGPSDFKSLNFKVNVNVNSARRISNCSILGSGTVTVRETTSDYECSCNPNEIRTGCAGVQRGSSDIYAVPPNGCRGEGIDRVQCLCYQN